MGTPYGWMAAALVRRALSEQGKGRNGCRPVKIRGGKIMPQKIGTVSRGLIAPIVHAGDDIAAIATDTLLSAAIWSVEA